MRDTTADIFSLIFLSLVSLLGVIPAWVFLIVFLLTLLKYTKWKKFILGIAIGGIISIILIMGIHAHTYYLDIGEGEGGGDSGSGGEPFATFTINRFLLLFIFVILPMMLTLGLRLSGADFRMSVGNALAISLLAATALYCCLIAMGYIPTFPTEYLNVIRFLLPFIPPDFINALISVAETSPTASVILWLYVGALLAIISSIIIYYATSIFAEK